MTEWTWIFLFSGGIALLVFLLIMLFARGQDKARARLQQVLSSPDLRLSKEDIQLFLTGEGGHFEGQMPVGQEARDEINELLVKAGIYSRGALLEYASIRSFLIIVPLLFTAFFVIMADQDKLTPIIGGGLAVAGLGFSLPRAYLAMRARKRQRDIERGLPVAVDLIALSLVGGQTLSSSLERVTRELGRAYPALAGELEIVRVQASLNTLSHALEQWAERVKIPEVHNLVAILIQADRQGANVAPALFEYSDNFRTTLRQRAEGHANRANVWLVFPTIFCLWIPAAIILVSPVLNELRKSREEFQPDQERLGEILTSGQDQQGNGNSEIATAP